MNQTKSGTETLQFIFTEKDFYLDAQSLQEKGGTEDGSPENNSPESDNLENVSSGDKRLDRFQGNQESWRSRFEADKYHALYQMGFEEKREHLTATEGFLRLLSDTFLKRLTSLPELELAREKVELKVPAEDVETLLKAVPFAIGAEYINAKWIDAVFRRLLEIYRREITLYSGTVEMYLTEKNQHLHVPERIFFHLVEYKDFDFPFAFLATYATKAANGKVRHVPLKYALTEYGFPEGRGGHRERGDSVPDSQLVEKACFFRLPGGQPGRPQALHAGLRHADFRVPEADGGRDGTDGRGHPKAPGADGRAGPFEREMGGGRS